MPNCHCGKRALYNVLGQKALVCNAHKTPDMMNVISNHILILRVRRKDDSVQSIN